MNRTTRLQLVVVLFVALVAVACGGGSGESSSTTSDKKGASGAISDPKDVKDATIQIVSKGSFAQPSFDPGT